MGWEQGHYGSYTRSGKISRSLQDRVTDMATLLRQAGDSHKDVFCPLLLSLIMQKSGIGFHSSSAMAVKKKLLDLG
jgi:hypothetical protein